MPDLEVVLKGFTGWLLQKNGTMSYDFDDNHTEVMLTLAIDDNFVVGVGVWDSSLFVVAANPEDESVKYRVNIGSIFAHPEVLGLEIVKSLLSFAQDANRNGNSSFEKGLIETAAELSLSIGSDLYSGFSLMHLGIHAKDVEESLYFAFLLTSAAVEMLTRTDNDEFLGMAIAAREQCWNAYLPEMNKLTDFMSPMKDEFLQLAPEADMEELAKLSGFYIRCFIPTLSADVTLSEEKDFVFLQLGSEGSDLITGGMNDFNWELMVLDYSEDGPYCRIPKLVISDPRNPDEVAFAFLLGLITEGIKNIPSADGRDIETRKRIAEISNLPIQPFIHSVVLLEQYQATMGIILKNLLEEMDIWDEIPSWLDSPALNEAINSFAEFFPNSYFLEDIFMSAETASFGYEPRG